MQKFEELPLDLVLDTWFKKNMGHSIDLGLIVAFLCLFVILWHSFVLIVRVLGSIKRPLLMAVNGIIVFRILNKYNQADLSNILAAICQVLGDAMVQILSKSMEYILKYVVH